MCAKRNPNTATQQQYPQARCIHQLIEQQVRCTPQALALTDGQQTMSYRELNERANQLAHCLQTLGIKPNVPVGACLERGIELIIGLLGILKAGGAYVPFDPTSPTERLAFMREDVQAPVLVTQSKLASRFSSQGTSVLCLDTDACWLTQQSMDDPYSGATGNDLAYVLYTSGSTGMPKGVQITHSNVLNLVFWHQNAFSLVPSDRASQQTSPAFDAAGWEIWPYLTCGASVHVIAESIRKQPLALRDWFLAKNITMAFLPTPLAEQVITLEWPHCTSLRFLLTGGDTLHRYPPASLPFTLVNNYGPTETTVVATSGPILPAARSASPPTIGRPIANTQIYILDEEGQQVAPGVVGELYIGGDGVARGYFHRPELTAKQFIANPFTKKPGARLYRTGDRGRYRENGEIEFLGRTDFQINLHGYRIEPNEIVTLLNEQAGVKTSAVIAREDSVRGKYLVAYIVPEADSCISENALRAVLEKRLPHYMIPTTFVQLETLPLTAHGKLDRAAFPEPHLLNSLHDNAAEQTQTPLEAQLAVIVTQLMGLERVGRDENFFLLGGHSLLGTQLIMRIAATFGVELPLRTLFEYPTIRHLAAEIEQRIPAGGLLPEEKEKSAFSSQQ